MKICIRCKESKPYSDYYKHKNMADGHLGRCKECHKSEIRRNRSEKIDYYRAYDAYRFIHDTRVKERHARYSASDAGKASLFKSRRKYIEANPEKRAAHILVNNAVRSGRLSKPECCPSCGEFKPSRQIHAHHEDYAKPLDVIWMCSQCHYDLHKRLD